jgi:sec-independent protein translocase protein TatB
VFGLGFGEMVVLGVVLLVVVGPRELPKLLRSVGRGITKLRQMSADLRQQSGIDDIINEEGLREDLDAIRSLSRGRVVDGLVGAAMAPARRPANRPRLHVKSLETLTVPDGDAPDRALEYPEVGPDANGALADDASAEDIEAARAARAALAEARSVATPAMSTEGTTT